MAITIVSNKQPRWTLDGHELNEEEAKEFDYLEGNRLLDATFFRYKGHLYDMGEAMRMPEGAEDFKGWDGYYGESFFSGVLVKLVEDGDKVIVGRYFS